MHYCCRNTSKHGCIRFGFLYSHIELQHQKSSSYAVKKEFNDFFRIALEQAWNEKRKRQLPPPRSHEPKRLLDITHTTISNLLYFLTKLLPKALEVGSSNSFLWLSSENTFLPLPPALLIHKRKKVQIIKRKKKNQDSSEESTL